MLSVGKETISALLRMGSSHFVTKGRITTREVPTVGSAYQKSREAPRRLPESDNVRKTGLEKRAYDMEICHRLW